MKTALCQELTVKYLDAFHLGKSVYFFHGASSGEVSLRTNLTINI